MLPFSRDLFRELVHVATLHQAKVVVDDFPLPPGSLAQCACNFSCSRQIADGRGRGAQGPLCGQSRECLWDGSCERGGEVEHGGWPERLEFFLLRLFKDGLRGVA